MPETLTDDRAQDARLAELLGLPVRWALPPYADMAGYPPGAKYPWLYGEHEGVNYQWARVEVYGSSLDAMHAVEAELARRGLRRRYKDALVSVVIGYPDWTWSELEARIDEVICATAVQKRAAAIAVLEGATE